MRELYVDASAFITLAGVGEADLLVGLDGRPIVLDAIAREIVEDPAATALAEGAETGWFARRSLSEIVGEDRAEQLVERAGSFLGREPADPLGGDLALLAVGLADRDPTTVVITDDKPLRGACKAHSIPLSGSLGVVIAAVEHGAVTPERAKDIVVAMDSVGARFSASLLKRAERLIDEAAEE